jgi:hypothetical protein
VKIFPPKFIYKSPGKTPVVAVPIVKGIIDLLAISFPSFVQDNQPQNTEEIAEERARASVAKK